MGVLDWFASLWEIGRSDYWGYVTTGGTESIMYGLYSAREQHPDGMDQAREADLNLLEKIPLSASTGVRLVRHQDTRIISYSDVCMVACGSRETNNSWKCWLILIIFEVNAHA